MYTECPKKVPFRNHSIVVKRYEIISNRQNNLTKTIAQINDCLFICMKLKLWTFKHVPHLVRRKEWFVCAYGALHYGQFQAAIISCVHCVAVTHCITTFLMFKT